MLWREEVSLCKGEMYSFVNNKKGNGKKTNLVDCIKGMKSRVIIDVVCSIIVFICMFVKETY